MVRLLAVLLLVTPLPVFAQVQDVLMRQLHDANTTEEQEQAHALLMIWNDRAAEVGPQTSSSPASI